MMKLLVALYGIDLGDIFCGESMFSKSSNSSKVALYYLVKELKKNQYKFIDCQVPSEHLRSLGGENISRKNFLDLLKDNKSFISSICKQFFIEYSPTEYLSKYFKYAPESSFLPISLAILLIYVPFEHSISQSISKFLKFNKLNLKISISLFLELFFHLSLRVHRIFFHQSLMQNKLVGSV